MARRLSERRATAALAALQKLVDDRGGKQGGQSAAERDFPALKQATISAALARKKIGEQLADAIADAYDTTLDGLVFRFGGGQGVIAARDIPGWRKAKDEARRRMAPALEAWAWASADDVVLPRSPGEATPELAYDIALLLVRHCTVSGVISLQRR